MGKSTRRREIPRAKVTGQRKTVRLRGRAGGFTLRGKSGLTELAVFAEPGYIKGAWALRVLSEGHQSSACSSSCAMPATDDEPWKKFKGG